MSGDHNQYQKPRSYLDDFECPRCGHCCKSDLATVGEVGVWGECEPQEVFVENNKRKTRDYIVDTDEGARADTTIEALEKLKPVFASDGCITAGNSSQTSDGCIS